MTQKTPLHPEHLALGAKMCPFAGYDMPINYAPGVIKEHEWTRSHAGLFDVSHMGQAIVSGKGAAEFFSRITPSSFLKTPNGRAKYTVLTNDRGGIIDDLIITRMEEDKFFVVFNAGRKDVDIAWMKQNLPAGVTFEELSGNALVALQGPKAEAVLAKEIPDAALAALPYMTMKEARWKGTPVFISRLGYTGEDGFEISLPADKAAEFWKALLQNPDVQAIGLAARDSLRLEMGYPLYGHDLNEETTPVEAALGWVITKEHNGFIGSGPVLAQMASGPARKRVGVKLTESGIAREGAKLYAGRQEIGTLTSGGFSPSLKVAIGQGYVKSEFAREGQAVEVEVRGRKIPAVIHGLSFMPAQTKPSALKKVTDMSNVPSDLKYTEQHEWLKLDGDVATVGITDYAQGALGDLVFVELPAKGKQVKQGDAFVVVESVKAASEVYAPIAGEVIEVNEALSKSPELINSAPYAAGWICKIKASDKGELAKLLDAAKYQSLIA